MRGEIERERRGRRAMERGWKLVQTIELVAKDAKMVKRLELSRDGKTLLVVSFSKCIVAFDVVGAWRTKTE